LLVEQNPELKAHPDLQAAVQRLREADLPTDASTELDRLLSALDQR
jgi:hypothetical protein